MQFLLVLKICFMDLIHALPIIRRVIIQMTRKMALANAELLLQSYPKIKQRDFVEAWLQAFQRDPRPGYSTYMYQLMNENLSPEEFCSRVHANKGTTSGAAMRAAPLGLLADLELVKKNNMRAGGTNTQYGSRENIGSIRRSLNPLSAPWW